MENKKNIPAIPVILGYILLAVVTVIGFGAIYNRMADGLIITNLTQHMPWGIFVALYIYFIGLSAGSFLISTLVYVFGAKKLEPIGPIALVQALICLALGLLAIFLDLGQPFKAFLVITQGNPTSVLTWVVRFYNLYMLVVLVELIVAMRPGFANLAQKGGVLAPIYKLLAFGTDFDREAWKITAVKILFVFGILGIPIAITVHSGVGSLFAVIKARPHWFTGLFPIIFIVSALASGGGMLAFLTAMFLKIDKELKHEIVRFLANLTIYILVFDQLLMFFEILVIYYGSIPSEIESYNYMIFGPTWSWTVFWFMQICVGVIAPALLILVPKWSKRTSNLGWAGLLVVLGMMATRLNIVIPAQIPPVMEGLDVAYPSNFRWEVGYTPCMVEILASIGVLALSIWFFILAFRLLPVQPHQNELDHEEVKS